MIHARTRYDTPAQVCIVNDHCREVYSSYVSVDQPITDYRTHVSGITPRHLANAPSLDHVRAEVAALLNGRICVGHDLAHDLEALKLELDPAMVRDTARGLPRRLCTRSGRPKRLRDLAAHHLRLTIQACTHLLCALHPA